MRDIVLELLSSYGYAGMFALILIENLFPPIPSEVILTFGGFMTTYTRMNIAGAVLAATAGSVLGALILYELGRHIPVQKFYAFLGGAWGKRLGVEVEDVKDADGWLERTGRSAVFFCRFVPIIRSLISIPAGMAGMRLVPFFLYTAAGSTVWNILLVGLGAAAGQSWPRVAAAIASASAALKWALGLTAAALLVAVFVRRRAVDAKRHRTL